MDRYIEFILNHYVLSLAFAVVTFLLIQELIDSAFKKFSLISPMLAVAKMNEADVLILDVREPDEFTARHIENAVNTPLNKLPEQLSKYEARKALPIFIMCQTGTRSLSAGKILTKAGFTQVHVITGGMQAWEDEYKLPVKTSGKQKK
jgi:rhodanese-related sulfurtransferase